jgi:hypothetical protein
MQTSRSDYWTPVIDSTATASVANGPMQSVVIPGAAVVVFVLGLALVVVLFSRVFRLLGGA